MKKILLFFLTIYTFTINAQNYNIPIDYEFSGVCFDCPGFEQVSKTIVTEDKEWVLCDMGYSTFKFIGDTTIDSLKYLKLHEKKYDKNNKIFCWEFNGIMMREDSNRVYIYANPTEVYSGHSLEEYHLRKDLLLYDFNLNIGDTIQFLFEEYPSVVTWIDSIETHCKQAKKLKRIVFNDRFYWIEGIGDTRDLTQIYATGAYYMNSSGCAYKGINFFNNIYNCLWTSPVANITTNTYNIKIYPTIVNDILIVDIDNNVDVSVNIYNTQGTLFLSEDICQSGSINCLQLPSGTYIVQIKDKDGYVIKTERIVKK